MILVLMLVAVVLSFCFSSDLSDKYKLKGRVIISTALTIAFLGFDMFITIDARSTYVMDCDALRVSGKALVAQRATLPPFDITLSTSTVFARDIIAITDYVQKVREWNQAVAEHNGNIKAHVVKIDSLAYPIYYLILGGHVFTDGKDAAKQLVTMGVK